MEILYSLGTVVKVKDDPTEYTIIGYWPEDENGKAHTYVGINAALGLSLRAAAKCFDTEEIDQIVHLGYSEEKSELFRIRLGRLMAGGDE